MASIDWSEGALVEVDPERVSGRPVLKGTRMPVDDILANYEYGVSVAEISEQFRIAPDTVQDVLNYAKSHTVVPCWIKMCRMASDISSAITEWRR